jgi:hypothetical protein
MQLSHISEVLPEALAVAHRDGGAPVGVDNPRPGTLEHLRDEFARREALANPDVTVPTKALRLTEEGTLAVSELGGTFAFTDWSKRQVANIVGVRWDRWFAKMSPAEQADEVNKRLWSSDQRLKVRTSRLGSPNGVTGVVNALVSPTFTPLPDTQVLGLLEEALRPVEPRLSVVRPIGSDSNKGVVVGIGRPFRPGDDKEVGDVWGCLSVRNSGVGFAAASFVASLHRLLCKNGMVAPIPDASLLHRAHRAFDMSKLRRLLAERLQELPGRLADAGRVLVSSRREHVADAKAAFEEILRTAHLPRKLVSELERAYEKEAALKGSAFGISQAATRAAQGLSPEERFELERAAGQWLAVHSGSQHPRR